MPGSNSRPNVSEGYEVPTELPGSTGYLVVTKCKCIIQVSVGLSSAPYNTVPNKLFIIDDTGVVSESPEQLRKMMEA